jgi:quercetin dioxygenase-like cupin family protein
LSFKTASDKKQMEEEAKLYRFSEMKEEWLNPKLSRRMVVGKNEMLGYIVLLKGCYVPPHRHVSEQMTVIFKGALKFSVNGKEIIVREGEALAIPPNVEHAAVALEDTIDLDCFSPLREDWLTGRDQYLRGGESADKKV